MSVVIEQNLFVIVVEL